MAEIVESRGSGPTSRSRHFDRTVRLEPAGTLSVTSRKGTIDLEPWDRAEVHVIARVELAPDDGRSEDEVARFLDGVEVVVRGEGDSVEVVSDYQRLLDSGERRRQASGSWPDVHYRIQAPASICLRIKDHRSRIRFRGFHGRFDLHLHHSRLEAGGLGGELSLATHRGTVELDGHAGSIQATTHRGTLDLRDLEIGSDSRAETRRGKLAISLEKGHGVSLVVALARRGTYRGDHGAAGLRKQMGGTIVESIGEGGPHLVLESERGSVSLASG